MRKVGSAADWRPRLTGAHLFLRPLVETDLDALYRAASDPLIWEQHPERLRHTRERFEVYFRTGMESGGALAIIDRRSGEMIGSSRFRDYRQYESSVEIGYTFLARRFWGTGCNGELKRLMLAHAFRFVDTVFFVVGPENHRSRAALAKIGAEEVDIARPGADARCSIVYRLQRSSDMDEPSQLRRLLTTVRLWKTRDPKAKLFSTVDQSDIRGLQTVRPAEPHDVRSSGAASI